MNPQSYPQLYPPRYPLGYPHSKGRVLRCGMSAAETPGSRPAANGSVQGSNRLADHRAPCRSGKGLIHRVLYSPGATCFVDHGRPCPDGQPEARGLGYSRAGAVHAKCVLVGMVSGWPSQMPNLMGTRGTTHTRTVKAASTPGQPAEGAWHHDPGAPHAAPRRDDKNGRRDGKLGCERAWRQTGSGTRL